MIAATIEKEDAEFGKLFTLAPINDATFKHALKEMSFNYAEGKSEVERIDRANNIINKVFIIVLVAMAILVRMY